MASTPSATQADPQHDGGDAATETDTFTEVEDELARLVQAKYAPRISSAFGAAMLDADNLRPPTPRASRSRSRQDIKRGTLAGVAIAVFLCACAVWAWRSHNGPTEDIVASADAPSDATVDRLAADPVPPIPNPAPAPAVAPPPVETSAPPPPPPIQAAAQGGRQAAPQARSITPPAPTGADAPNATAERPQGETRELAALRETVDALAAGQRKLTVDISRLQAANSDRPLQAAQPDRPLRAQKPDRPPAEAPHARTTHRESAHRVSAHRPPPAAAPARKTAQIKTAQIKSAQNKPRQIKPAAVTPTPPQAPRQISMASPVAAPPRPALQIPAGPQPADAPLRPPMPVP